MKQLLKLITLCLLATTVSFSQPVKSGAQYFKNIIADTARVGTLIVSSPISGYIQKTDTATFVATRAWTMTRYLAKTDTATFVVTRFWANTNIYNILKAVNDSQNDTLTQHRTAINTLFTYSTMHVVAAGTATLGAGDSVVISVPSITDPTSYVATWSWKRGFAGLGMVDMGIYSGSVHAVSKLEGDNGSTIYYTIIKIN
jgi:hypothetical protein